jgi:hypothetical protein
MKKNIVTIIFLFSLIFVTLMFGQDVEGFDLIDQTDPNGPSGKNNGTYFTKETNGVSVFSALKDFSNAIRDKVNNYSTTKGATTTTSIKANFLNCIETVNAGNSEYKPAERQECYNTHYKTQLQSFGSSTFTNGAGKNLLDAVNKNTGIKVTTQDHDSNKQTILDTNKSNIRIQRQLDRKMSEMLSDKSGIKLESATKENSTMYVNILWTVLAATTLYYIFIRL